MFLPLPLHLPPLLPPDGDWVLPDSEVVIRGFLDTLSHCYYDLYWCWENTGLRGNFALDFVNEWNARAGPVAAGWAAAQEQWIGAVARFEGRLCRSCRAGGFAWFGQLVQLRVCFWQLCLIVQCSMLRSGCCCSHSFP